MSQVTRGHLGAQLELVQQACRQSLAHLALAELDAEVHL
jgi:hypothetical protein